MGKTLTPSLLGCCRFWVAREANRWKISLKGCIVGWTDGPPVPSIGSSDVSQPAKYSLEPTFTVIAPTLYSDASSVYPVLKVIHSVRLSNLNTGIEWTTRHEVKRQFIWCWSKNLGASFYDSNEGIRWTAALTVGSFGDETIDAQNLLLRNPKAPDEPLLRRRFIQRWLFSSIAAEIVWHN
jgi:hypothetical protein